jgi:hypothetical protein
VLGVATQLPVLKELTCIRRVGDEGLIKIARRSGDEEVLIVLLAMGARPVVDEEVVVLATQEIACRVGDEEMIIVLATKEIACDEVIVVVATKEIARCVGNAAMGAHACNDCQHGENSGPPCWRRGYCVVWEGGRCLGGVPILYCAIYRGDFFLTLVCKRATSVDKGY